MIILALILGLVFLFLSLMRPHLVYGIILALLPSYIFRFDILNIPTTALEVMIGIFLLGVLVSQWNRQSWNKIIQLGWVNLAVGLFVLAGIISMFVSPEPTRALGQLKAFIIEPVLLFYAAIVLFKSTEEYRKPLKILFWSAAIISLFALIQYYTHIWLPLRFWGYGEEVKRITSVFEYPNALALYLAPLLLLFTTLQTKGWLFKNQAWPLIGLGIMAAASVMTYSRGGWIAIVVGLIVLALQQSKLSLRRWATVGALILLILSPVITTRLKQTFNDKSSSERMALFNIGADRAINDPIFGNGLYGFRTTLENSNYTGEVLNYPHNIILNFWLEMGLLGLTSFLVIIYLVVKNYLKNKTHLGLAVCMFMLVVIVHGLVDVPYFKNDLSVLFWFITSMVFVKTQD